MSDEIEGSRRVGELKVGDSASIERVIGPEDVALFVQLTGDDNPVHLDDGYAADLNLGGRVVHGMLTASYVSTVIGTVLPGPGALWLSERFNFRSPVRVGDRVRVEVKVRQISPGTGTLVLDVNVRNQRGTVNLDGEAQVQLLEKATDVEREERRAAVAVVTGSGRGIGSAIARRLASDGMQVVVNYLKDEASANETVKSIRSAGGKASLFQANVADSDQVAALIAHANITVGPVDVLVNNAGGALNRRPLDETTWEEVEDQLGTHLQGTFLCVRAVLPGMVERRFGRIVNITSQAAYGTPPSKQTAYVIAKAAQAAFTRCVAVEAGAYGVTANAVAPGMAETDLVADVSPRMKMTLAAQAPLRRLVTVEEVADSVSFLVSPRGSFITGQTIHLSGGHVMS